MKIKHSPIARGFNLVELAVVLLIFSLLIGGVLRGEELINSAKARNLIDQKTSFQTAFVAFSNRFKLLPGDLTAAQAGFIANGVVAPSTTCPGDGIVTFDANSTPGCGIPESVLAFQNLTATGLLSCAYCLRGNINAGAAPDNTMNNSFGHHLQFGQTAGSNAAGYWLDPLAGGVVPVRNILTTGSRVSVNILQQIDLKADDGSPQTGAFRQSGTGGASGLAACTTGSAAAGFAWTTAVNINCAGAWLF
jgi:prepilin-type N-terminal cleavage/methylation domain-containing protein